MKDFTRGFDDDDFMNARANRSQPDVDPGMGDDDGEDSWDSISDDSWGGSFGGSKGGFGNDEGFGPSFGGGDSPFNNDSPFGNPGMGGMSGMGGNSFGNNTGFSSQYGSPNRNMPQNNQMQNPEDKFWGTIISGAKTGVGALGTLIKSFQEFNAVQRKDFGAHTILTSFICGGIGVIFQILGWSPYGWHMIAGSFFALGLSIPVFMFAMDDMKNNPQSVMQANDSFGEEEGFETEGFETEGFEDSTNENLGFDDGPDSPFNEKPDDKKDSLWDSLDEPGFENPFFEEPTETVVIEDKKDPKKVIEEIEVKLENNELDSKMLTNQFLYNTMLGQLDCKKPDYSKSKFLDEDSKEFLAFCNMVEQASQVVGGKNGVEAPQVISIEERLFYYLIKIERPSWLTTDSKINQFVKEIVSICAYDESTNSSDESITGSGQAVGTKVNIKIMKGENALVTLKDVYISDKVKKEVLDGKMKMPIVFGIGQQGEEVYKDFKDIHALLVAGAPRSGKSWTVKSLLAQLMMFKKPSEFQFYIVDAKTKTSDFFYMTVPHVREFITDDDRLLEVLRELNNVEAKRREDIFFKRGGVLNIDDFHKKNPFEKMPYILVVIDEIITISNRMDKETHNEFMGLLKQFTTRLPNLGIRILMVPHVIKNEVIDKTITDMIPNRIIVKGDEDAVESITGATPKKFPIKLSHKGDMALKLDNAGVTFAHSAIISDTNEGFDTFFEFLTNFWLNMEPESFVGSKLENDIRLGYRSVDSFSGIKQEYIDKLTKEIEDRKSVRVLNAPKRPTHKVVEEDIEDEDDDFETDFQKLKEEQKGKKSIKNSKKDLKTTIKKSSSDGAVLNDNEIHSLLEGVHQKPSTKGNIKIDETLM